MPALLLDLDVHLEPIVRLGDGATVAEELLLRPASGGALLERAAHEGVPMASITERALAAAGEALARRRRALHVNVTPADLADPGFPASVAEALPADALGHLVLEVTEQTELVASRQLARTLVALRRRGVRFAIDDFGDGWAGPPSTALVRPEVVKVRLGRLRDPATGPALTASVRRAAATHHARVVVEQVETAEDLLSVLRLGFTHAQGWYWPESAEPDPPE